jgi:D-alanyl-D-alanine carboxypeptidase
MKIMNKLYIAGLLAFILLVNISCEKDIYATQEVSCDNTLLQNASSHPKATAYQALLEKYVAKGFPGMSMLIEDSSGIWVGAAGMADIHEGIEFSPCHVSKAASITKILNYALVMKLQEEGVWDIDEAVTNYISSDILNKIEHPEGMTIKDLMQHTTGIFDIITSSSFYLEILNNPDKDWTGEELIKFAYNQPANELTADYPSRYSNTNTLLLSLCIDAATGRSHADLLNEKVLDPLGMTNTYYQSREDLPKITAQGYFDLHNDQTLMNVSNFITGSGNGYGGVFSNVFDLKVFLDALFIDQTLLSQASLDEMTSAYYASSTIEYTGELVQTGPGLLRKFTYPSPSADAASHANLHGAGLGHSGKDLGYTANMFYFPDEEQTMIFFINYGTDGNSYLKEVFWDFENELMDIMFQ